MNRTVVLSGIISFAMAVLGAISLIATIALSRRWKGEALI